MTEPRSSRTNLLLFDGVCGLCIGAVQSILARDPRGLIHFCSIQSELGNRLYEEQGLNPKDPTTMVLLTPAGALTRSDAMIEIGRILGGWSRWVLLLKVIPRALRDWAYHFIALHRYRWFGRRDECLVPQPEWKERFVS